VYDEISFNMSKNEQKVESRASFGTVVGVQKLAPLPLGMEHTYDHANCKKALVLAYWFLQERMLARHLI